MEMNKIRQMVEGILNKVNATSQLEKRIVALEAAIFDRQQSNESSCVFFNAFRTSPFSQPSRPINYNHVRLNVGNGLDATTGVFTAPVGGVYVFHFNGYYNKNKAFDFCDHAEVNLIHNGTKLIGKTTSGSKYGSFSFSVVLSLISGDTICAVLRYGHIIDNRNMHTQFSGYLLKKYGN